MAGPAAAKGEALHRPPVPPAEPVGHLPAPPLPSCRPGQPSAPLQVGGRPRRPWRRWALTTAREGTRAVGVPCNASQSDQPGVAGGEVSRGRGPRREPLVSWRSDGPSGGISSPPRCWSCFSRSRCTASRLRCLASPAAWQDEEVSLSLSLSTHLQPRASAPPPQAPTLRRMDEGGGGGGGGRLPNVVISKLWGLVMVVMVVICSNWPKG